VENATQIQEQIVLTEYQDEQGPYWWIEKVVVVKLPDGIVRDLLDVMTEVMNFWQQHLGALGVIAKPRIYEAPEDKHPKSRAECERSRLDLEMVQGLRFNQVLSLRRYNYETGTVKPMDLSGSQLRSYIYEPGYQLNFSLRNDASGKEFTRSISLTEDESEVFSRLQSAEEKQAYVSGLPQAQEALRELIKEAKIAEIQS
jgi:hypothetical protein